MSLVTPFQEALTFYQISRANFETKSGDNSFTASRQQMGRLGKSAISSLRRIKLHKT